MVMARVSWLLRAVMALTLAVVLAGTGAAHRPVERPGAAAALAAFVAAGGTLADLCHEAGDTGHGGHAAIECPACLLQKSAALIDLVAAVAPVPVLRAEVLRPRLPEPVPLVRLATLPPARGPPFLLPS